MRWRLSAMLLSLEILGLSPLPAVAADTTYLAELVRDATQTHLSRRAEWHKLLHYKAGMMPGSFKSQVDAPGFFLAHDGKTNPEAELDATLAAFFEPFSTDRDEQQLHPQCRFVARYHWLKSALHFDARRLPEYRCDRFEAWMEALNPQGATVIFPTAYVNSPASMFGHTLIRVDAVDQDDKTRLLAYAINFGADTGNDGGLAFALKGLMGGYPGRFSVLPYYLKVREYSDMENRDIWEYHLTLTPAETRTMLMHAWEMRGIWFDYFFFDENCSYHLLSLIETARPDLELTDRFGAWAIPSDTVRVLDEAGLIDEVVYRPSRRAVLRYRMDGLDENEIGIVRRLAEGQLVPRDSAVTGLARSEQAKVLEVAHEYADYRHDGDEQRLHNLLRARSALAITSQEVVVPAGTAPDKGHATTRSSLNLGREGSHGYQDLQFRPAYHDLLDPAPGYTEGAEIEFFNVALRHDSQAGTTRLQELTPVHIVSLTPVSEIATPLSWRFDFGLRRKHGQRYNTMLATINGGVGWSWAPVHEGIAYALFDIGVDAAHRELRRGFAAGVGGSIGFLTQISRHWALHVFASGTDYAAGEVHFERRLGLEQRYTLGQADTVRLAWSRERQLADEFRDVNLSWQHFF